MDHTRGTANTDSGDEANDAATRISLLQEIYGQNSANLVNRLRQTAGVSTQDYFQNLQLFATSLSIGKSDAENADRGFNGAGSAPSSGFVMGSHGAIVTEDSDQGRVENASNQPSASNVGNRNRRAFSGSGQTISQHTRDRLKTMIATKKQKQRLQSSGSMGSQTSVASNSRQSWGGHQPALKCNSDANLMNGPFTTTTHNSARTSAENHGTSAHFDPYLPADAISSTPGQQLNDFQLRKVNSEPNLKMRLRARLLNKGSSPVTNTAHPYNQTPIVPPHKQLQRCESDSIQPQMLWKQPSLSELSQAHSSNLLSMTPNFVIPSPSLPNLSQAIENLQLNLNLMMQSPFASFLSMPSLVKNSSIVPPSSMLDPLIDQLGVNRFDMSRPSQQLPIGGYPSLLKQQLRDLVLRRKSLVREEPEDEQIMDAISQQLQSVSEHESQLKTGLAYDGIMCKHQCLCGDNQNHVEHGGRVHSIWARLQERGLTDICERSAMKKANLDLLRLAHTPTYVTFFAVSPTACLKMEASELPLKSFVQLNCGGIGVDTDTYFNDASTQTAIRVAVGSLVELTAQVVEGKLRNGFACIRPPGHHAEREQAMGFCFFNNVAITAKYIQRTYPNCCQRIAIVDWDVHHGNGTQLCFETDPQVLYISMHRHDNGNFFPGTGAVTEIGVGEGRGYTVNIPFSGDTMGDAEYLAAWRVIVLPLLDVFKPDLVLVSSGFDAARGHAPALGGYEVSPRLFGYFTRTLLNYAQGKVVLALEGGYDLPSICDSAEECVKALCNDGGDISQLSTEVLEKVPNQAAQDTIQKVIAVHKKMWPLNGIQGINVSKIPSKTNSKIAIAFEVTSSGKSDTVKCISSNLESRSKDDLILIIKSQLKKVKQCKQECAELNQQLTEIRIQQNEVTTECSSTVLSLELCDSKKTIETLRKDCSTKEDELAEQSAVISKLTGELQTSVAENGQLMNDLESAVKLSDELKLELSELKEELSLTADKAALATSKNDTILQLEKEKKEMLVIIEEGKEDCSRLTEEIHQLKQTITGLQNKNQAIEDEYDKTALLIQGKTTGTNEVAAIRKELNAVKGQLDTCYAQLDAEIQKSSVLNDELLAKQRYSNSLKDDLEKLQRQFDANIMEFKNSFRLKEHEQETIVKELQAELEGIRYNYGLKEAELEEIEKQRFIELRLLAQQPVEAVTNSSAITKDHELVKAIEDGQECKVRHFPEPLNFNTQPQFDFDESFKPAVMEDRAEMLQSLHDLLSANEPLNHGIYEDTLPRGETAMERDLLYTRELLQETEEMNVKLQEQIQVLKSEIRKHSAEQAMEKKVMPNMEYFKNIVLHFAAPSAVSNSGQDIRKQLLPVLSEMLCLTQDERSKLENDINLSQTSKPREISNYFGSLSDIL